MNASTKTAPRRATVVIQELLDEMDRIVRDYHPEVGRTGRSVADLVQGTAFFPGGSGLWRGARNGGALPSEFPENSVMLVAHNYDSIRSHNTSLANEGEVEGAFWAGRLLPILHAAGIVPEHCFFTNVLMGLQPMSATGAMPKAPGYIEQCLEYLARQIAIVRPRVVVTLGGDARHLARSRIPKDHNVRHPSDSYHFSARATRDERIAAVGRQLAEIVNSHAADIAAS